MSIMAQRYGKDKKKNTENTIRSSTAEYLTYVPSEKVPDDEYLKLGYVPRVNNKILARLMDAGKYLYGVVRLKEMDRSFHHIVVKIYMKD